MNNKEKGKKLANNVSYDFWYDVSEYVNKGKTPKEIATFAFSLAINWSYFLDDVYLSRKFKDFILRLVSTDFHDAKAKEIVEIISYALEELGDSLEEAML